MTSERISGDASFDELSRLASAVERGELTRGALISRAAALGVTLAGVGALAGPAAAATGSLGAQTVRRGGHFRVGTAGNGTNDTLDPAKAVDPVDAMRIRALYDSLFIQGPDFKPIPWLASDYDVSKDGKTWTFRIARDAAFHNGAPVTAQDVAFTIQRIRDPKVSSHADNLRFMKGSTMRIIDRKTIRYRLQEAYADFPTLLAEMVPNVVPRSFDATKANTAPIGSGPFKFESFTPGQSSVFSRNTEYWREPYPYVDELTISDIPDESARINALVGKQIDFIQGLSYSSIRSVVAGGATFIERKGSTYAPIVLVQDLKPFANRNLRLAFAHSIDRKKIVDVVYRGYAVVGNDHPLGPGYNNRPVGIPQRRYDPDKAKFYMKKAGYSDGIDLTLITGDVFAGMVDTAVIAANQAKVAGFRIKVNKWPSQTFWDEVWLKKNFYISAWAPYGSSELMVAKTVYSDGAYNEIHFRNKQVDKWLATARQSVNPRVRTDMYTKSMRAVHEAASWIIPAYGSLVHGAGKSVRFQQLPPATAGPWFHTAWFAS